MLHPKAECSRPPLFSRFTPSRSRPRNRSSFLTQAGPDRPGSRVFSPIVQRGDHRPNLCRQYPERSRPHASPSRSGGVRFDVSRPPRGTATRAASVMNECPIPRRPCPPISCDPFQLRFYVPTLNSNGRPIGREPAKPEPVYAARQHVRSNLLSPPAPASWVQRTDAGTGMAAAFRDPHRTSVTSRLP